MKNYVMIELKSNKYIIVDILDYNNKKYFLLIQVLNETDINDEFEICIFNGEKNSFEELVDEFEYNYIKDIFEKRLDNIRQELIRVDNISNIVKLKLIGINNNSYTFEKNDGERIFMNIELFDNFKLEINDYLYILEETTKENITIRFGKIYNNETEIIKITRGNDNYYLQRYYS